MQTSAAFCLGGNLQGSQPGWRNSLSSNDWSFSWKRQQGPLRLAQDRFSSPAQLLNVSNLGRVRRSQELCNPS
jgi:hypothetical protein